MPVYPPQLILFIMMAPTATKHWVRLKQGLVLPGKPLLTQNFQLSLAYLVHQRISCTLILLLQHWQKAGQLILLLILTIMMAK